MDAARACCQTRPASNSRPSAGQPDDEVEVVEPLEPLVPLDPLDPLDADPVLVDPVEEEPVDEEPVPADEVRVQVIDCPLATIVKPLAIADHDATTLPFLLT